jgi:hypothetical protein
MEEFSRSIIAVTWFQNKRVMMQDARADCQLTTKKEYFILAAYTRLLKVSVELSMANMHLRSEKMKDNEIIFDIGRKNVAIRALLKRKCFVQLGGLSQDVGYYIARHAGASSRQFNVLLLES